MEARAYSKNNRISAKKARLVANEIRGISYLEAVDFLKAMPQKSAQLILKVLKSAGANAKHLNPNLNEADLFIKKINIDEGITRRGLKIRARGRANRILKRTSHINIILSDEK